ncbi:hypothetical protein GUITHDRAFT_103989 [Guillardia theta CCMP2712]|uniref:Uncharacterized protein n=2 Tax=Guillardia theta TaxID=55529 RepID=L1JQ21_GUITC|nr:hypothetical protein GUITHDRAFT_103989 [Guillardia theta CCMP2712]EKX50178.1 hypothetical protein GUITHDRAFT_103989 [Guillardia theta CCMP2712]|eukprot:XP_005837158.1 hypothetical protein GUITHDRAFT_103989 [Guillardia theta CCMP2712]
MSAGLTLQQHNHYRNLVYRGKESKKPQKIVFLSSSLTTTRVQRVSSFRLKNLLESKRVTYHHVDLAIEDRADEFARLIGTRALPLLLIDDKVLGGEEEVQFLEDMGELDAKLGIDR